MKNLLVIFLSVFLTFQTHSQHLDVSGNAVITGDISTNSVDAYSLNASRLYINGGTNYLTGRTRIGSTSIGSSQLNVISTLTTYNNNGDRLFRTTNSSSGAGYISTHGPGGTENVRFTNHSSNGDRGFMGVRDENGAEQAGIFVNSSGNGIVWGDTKNFRMNHPEEEDKEIWYASLEGPEAAAYLRGSAKLKNGKVFVPLSDDFRMVINTATMTVLLTPGSADTYGIAAVDKTPTGFMVQELAGGKGNYSFDWEVKGVRKGYENYKAVRYKELMGEDPVQEPKELKTNSKVGSSNYNKLIYSTYCIY